jgi:hypothetical protein
MNRKLLWSTATLLFWVAASPSVYGCESWEWRLYDFTLTQSNGFTVEVSIVCNPNCDGSAVYYPTDTLTDGSYRTRWVHGDLKNGQLLDSAAFPPRLLLLGERLDNRHLHFFVPWEDGNIGAYDAEFDSNSGKFISGKTSDDQHPDSTATWTTDATLECATPPPQQGNSDNIVPHWFRLRRPPQ